MSGPDGETDSRARRLAASGAALLLVGFVSLWTLYRSSDRRLRSAARTEKVGAASPSPAPRSVAPAQQTIPTTERRYDSLRAVPGEYAETPLCHLLSRAGAIYGIYRIESLTGRWEPGVALEGGGGAVTYVGLARVEGSGPSETIARIAGGPLPDGRDVFGVSIDLGETVGLILHPSKSGEQYTFDALDVFRATGGSALDNSQLVFADTKDFMARAAREQSGCPPPLMGPSVPRSVTDFAIVNVDDRELVGQVEEI